MTYNHSECKVVCSSDGKMVFILKWSYPFRFLFWDFGQLGCKEDGSAVAIAPDHYRAFVCNWKPNVRLPPIQGNMTKDQYKDICISVWGETGGREYPLGQDT